MDQRENGWISRQSRASCGVCLLAGLALLPAPAQAGRPAATLMRKGYAWDANLGDKDDDLAVSFYSDEACIGSFNLRYSGRGWLVVEIGSACD